MDFLIGALLNVAHYTILMRQHFYVHALLSGLEGAIESALLWLVIVK